MYLTFMCGKKTVLDLGWGTADKKNFKHILKIFQINGG